MAADSGRKQGGLPFEPKGKGTPRASAKPATPKANPNPQNRRRSGKSAGIPEAVSRRMVRRMAIFCGVPTFLGLATFPAGYLIFANHWIDLPNVAVLLISLGFLGLGVVGLSYGVISASWDEPAVGSVLGWQEFQLNLGRMIDSWKEARAQQRSR